MQITFSENQPFVVKNSIGILLFISFVSLAIFISGTAMNDGLPFVRNLFFGIPGLACIAALIHRKPLLIVDKKGIIIEGVRITDWAHFSAADFEEIETAVTISDHFYLWVEYSKPRLEGYFKTTVELTDTENKSEEAVIAAIDFSTRIIKTPNRYPGDYATDAIISLRQLCLHCRYAVTLTM